MLPILNLRSKIFRVCFLIEEIFKRGTGGKFGQERGHSAEFKVSKILCVLDFITVKG